MSVNDGFFNEQEFIDSLNNKKIGELSANLKSFIKTLYPNIKNEDFIYARKSEKPLANKNIKGNIKPDVTLEVDKKEMHVSLKIGTGNSTHEEFTENFLEYLKENFNISDELANDFRFFIWGDGTYDGSGKLEDRLSSGDIVDKYPTITQNIRKFLDTNKIKLIDRFLFTGKFDISVDFIYHGNECDGVWASKEELLPYITNPGNSKSAIYVGSLTFQTYGRSLQGNDDKRRKKIQIKCASLHTAIKEISKKRR